MLIVIKDGGVWTMISWTLLLSVPLVIIGAGTVLEWLKLWWSDERPAFTDAEFTAAVEARFPLAVRVRLVSAPSLTRVRGRFRRRPALDRQLLLGDEAGAVVAVDVSWLGRFTLEESVRRVAYELVGVRDLESTAAKRRKKKARFLLGTVGTEEATKASTSLRAALIESAKKEKDDK